MINIKNPPNFGGFSSLRVSPLKILTKGRAFGNRKGSALDPQAFEKA